MLLEEIRLNTSFASGRGFYSFPISSMRVPILGPAAARARALLWPPRADLGALVAALAREVAPVADALLAPLALVPALVPLVLALELARAGTCGCHNESQYQFRWRSLHFTIFVQISS